MGTPINHPDWPALKARLLAGERLKLPAMTAYAFVAISCREGWVLKTDVLADDLVLAGYSPGEGEPREVYRAINNRYVLICGHCQNPFLAERISKKTCSGACKQARGRATGKLSIEARMAAIEGRLREVERRVYE